MTLDTAELDRIAEGSHFNPHSILGLHQANGKFTLRVLRPLAKKVFAQTKQGELELAHLHSGIWELSGKGEQFDYRIRTLYPSGDEWVSADAYSFAPTIGELDLYLITEGRHEELWRALGSRVQSFTDSMGEISGVSFSVWAPNATAVRVVGNFNGWNGATHAMRSMGGSGVWEIFVPGLASGELYKYQIRTKSGHWITKIDPMGQSFENPPATSSVVYSSKYSWRDSEWLRQRAARDALTSPMSIYEVHLGSWRGAMNYRELAPELIGHVKHLGFTHIEFMPLAEHPFGGSWGYQVTGYYAPTARFGTPDDFRYLIDELHNAGIGVILDWVPAHFPKDDWALARFDGEALYEDADPRRGEHPDWGTFVFNLGRTEVRNFLVANANYWFEEFHIDGLRVDAVASMLYLDYSRNDGEWLPNIHGGRENLDAIRFLQETNATVYRRYPGIMMIAEESTAFAGVSAPTDQGGLGFGFKWNMGWMHDSLEYIKREPIHRKYHHGEITFSMLYAYNEKFVLPISHDEVVHGKGSLINKMPGDNWQKFANVRAYLGFMWTHPGKKLLFMGSEFGQFAEWSEAKHLDWHLSEYPEHQGLQLWVRDLNSSYAAHPALWELDHQPDGFRWIDGGNADQNLLSYLRYDSRGGELIVLVNFSNQAYFDFQLGVPTAGIYQELLNSDLAKYGGSDVRNQILTAEANESHGHPYSMNLSIPPLATLVLAKL